ncbi:MAG TPA: hypothetical protein DD670_11460 [Planctomycetaceae bacterium]|nr:hypothetical protein [Planctomycetaceae bacterium]
MHTSGLALLGMILLAVVTGCGQGEQKATIPDNVPPPPTRESMQSFTAPAEPTPSPDDKENPGR